MTDGHDVHKKQNTQFIILTYEKEIYLYRLRLRTRR